MGLALVTWAIGGYASALVPAICPPAFFIMLIGVGHLCCVPRRPTWLRWNIGFATGFAAGVCGFVAFVITNGGGHG